MNQQKNCVDSQGFKKMSQTNPMSRSKNELTFECKS